MQAQPQKLKVKKVGDYVLIRELGKGAFGSVWYAQFCDRNKPKTPFAIKEMKNDFGAGAQFSNMLRKREINNMYRITHQNLIQLYEIFSTSNNCYLVMEYAGGGTLKDYLQNRGGKLNEDQVLYFMVQLAEGLKALQDFKLMHRDLKPANILLSDTSNKPILKISDLGLSKSIEDEGQGQTKCGTRHYMAHEILKGDTYYDYKVDLWSTGVILYELLAGQKPFQGTGDYQLMANQLLGPNLEILNCSQQCKDLIFKLLITNPQKRISFEDFYNHP